VPDSATLVDAFTRGGGGDVHATSSLPDCQDLKTRNTVFSDMTGYSLMMAAVGLGDRSRLMFEQLVASDGVGGVFVGGSTQGSLGGQNAGAYDPWLARYDGAGNLVWGPSQFGTASDDFAFAGAPDGGGGVYVAGRTRGSLGGLNAGQIDAWLARFGESCYPDCDTSTGPGVLDIFDFLCFQNRYDAGSPYACDCGTSTGPGVCDIFDFLCFQNAFDAGGP
jgi:hypothetical protein